MTINRSRSDNQLTGTLATLLDPPTYTDLLIIDARGLIEKTIVVENTGAQGATIRMQGSVDGGVTYDDIFEGPTNVATTAKLVIKTLDYYTHIKVEAHRQVAAQDTSVDCRFAGRRNDTTQELV